MSTHADMNAAARKLRRTLNKGMPELSEADMRAKVGNRQLDAVQKAILAGVWRVVRFAPRNRHERRKRDAVERAAERAGLWTI